MELRNLFQRLAATFGIINNTILVLLIIHKSPKNLGSYKYLMIYISLFEIFYSSLDFLSSAEIYSRDSVFFIIINSNSAPLLPFWTIQTINLIFCSLFGVSLIIFAAHFMYRYFVVTGSRFIQEHQLQKVLGLIAFTVFVGFLWSFIAYSLFSPTSYSDQFISLHFLAPRHMDLSEITYMGAYFQPIDDTGKQFIDWNPVIGILLMTSVIFASFSTVFYFGYKVHQKINNMLVEAASHNTRNLQSQLFWALVFQTLIPLLLMHFPVTVAFLSSLFDISTEILGDIPTVTIFLYPALDPLPNFFIIKNYRDAILEFFGCLKLTERATGSTVPTGTANSKNSRQNRKT